MRIVSWNCAGGFCSRTNVAGSPKYQKIINELSPDILLLQECEHQDKFAEELEPYRKGWIGFTHEDRPGSHGRVIGVSVLCFNDAIKIHVREDFIFDNVRYVQPITVEYKCENFNLLNTWVNTGHFKDWNWSLFKNFIDERDTIIFGDFNWPSKDGSAMPLIQDMNNNYRLKLKSAYHQKTGETLGQETHMTNRARSRQKNEYLIDYCFVPSNWIPNIDFSIAPTSEWIDKRFSDHVPLILDINKYNDTDFKTKHKEIVMSNSKMPNGKQGQDEYNHIRAAEENLTEKFVKFIRASNEFQKIFIEKIYETVYNTPSNKTIPHFNEYTFSCENVISERLDKNCKNETVQFDILMIGKDKNNKDFHLIVENKVGDMIHLEQMEKYKNYLNDKNGLITTITKTGTFYDTREKLKGLINGNLYWNDIISMLEEFKTPNNKVSCLKENVLTKLKELDCKFYNYPECIEKREFKFQDKNKPIITYRKELQKASLKVFNEIDIFTNLGIDYKSKCNKNSPSGTINYEYIFTPKILSHQEIKKLFPSTGTCTRQITSILLWFSFGPKISSLTEDTYTFEQPRVDIQLWVPKEYPEKNPKKFLESYKKVRGEIKKKIPSRNTKDESPENDCILAKQLPLISLAENCKTKEELFQSVKNELGKTVQEWQKLGVFDLISDFWTEVENKI